MGKLSNTFLFLSLDLSLVRMAFTPFFQFSLPTQWSPPPAPEAEDPLPWELRTRLDAARALSL